MRRDPRHGGRALRSIRMRLRGPLSLLAVVAISAALGWALSRGSSGSRPKPTTGRSHQITTRTQATGLLGLPRGWAYIAAPQRHVHELVVYRARGSRRVRLVLPSHNAIGAPLTFLVHRIEGQWVQTYLPVRPNKSTGWVKRRSVKLLTTAYAVHVHLRRHRLFLLVSDHVVRNFPIGVGRSVTPTPSGRYFITELLKQPDPNGVYGPYAFGLSAYSGVLTHFGRGGNGQIGIHGTNEPQRLGTDVSHGCIRLRNPDIIWLSRRLPLGTPVLIDRT